MSFVTQNASPFDRSVGSNGALGSGSNLGSQNLENKILTFNYTGKPETFSVPSNCINVHVILFGAGGSSEEGYGGCGAYVECDLIPNTNPGWWNIGQPSTLGVVVGGGGHADNLFPKQSFGGGGGGRVTGIGQGGGRTAIQSVDPSGTVFRYKDRVVAAGGGGSTGLARGGNAGAYIRKITDVTFEESSQGENGFPEINAGRGAIVKVGSSDIFQQAGNGAGGNGGIVQGLT